MAQLQLGRQRRRNSQPGISTTAAAEAAAAAAAPDTFGNKSSAAGGLGFSSLLNKIHPGRKRASSNATRPAHRNVGDGPPTAAPVAAATAAHRQLNGRSPPVSLHRAYSARAAPASASMSPSPSTMTGAATAGFPSRRSSLAPLDSATPRTLPSWIRTLHDDEVPSSHMSDVQASEVSAALPPPPPHHHPPQGDYYQPYNGEEGAAHDAFYDARSSLSSAAPPAPTPPAAFVFPSKHSNGNGHPNGHRDETSVLSFGSLGPPTELLTSGMVSPGQQHLPRDFDVFRAIQNVQALPHTGPESYSAEFERIPRAELIKYYRALNGDTSGSNLSIGAEGIDSGYAVHPGHALPPQYQQAQSPSQMYGSRLRLDDGDEHHQSVQQRHLHHQQLPQQQRRISASSPSSPKAGAQSQHKLFKQHWPTNVTTNPSTPTSNGSPAGPTPDVLTASRFIGNTAAFIDSWRAEVKPAPVVSPLSTAVLVPTTNTTPSASPALLPGADATAAAAMGMTALRLDPPGERAGSTGAPSSLSVITVHGGALASAVDSPQGSERGGPGSHSSSGKGKWSSGGARTPTLTLTGSGSVSKSGTGTGATASIASPRSQPSRRTSEPLPSYVLELPPESVEGALPSPGGGGAPNGAHPIDGLVSASNSHYHAYGKSTLAVLAEQPLNEKRVVRPPPLGMSADGRPPNFGTITSATTFSGLTDLTSVSKR
ncbi:hypothetical protein OC834_006872 [Tilletia horrida]|nr:hypothetical protein OC834_006872 [Tilletia horrida]